MATPKRPRSHVSSLSPCFLSIVPLQRGKAFDTWKCRPPNNPPGSITYIVASIESRVKPGKQQERISSIRACVTLPSPDSEEKRLLERSENSRQNDGITTPASSQPENSDENARKGKPKRVMSEETRRKIAIAMQGQPRSEEMRAKVSQKMKGRIPWNKGKKLSPETRARMSEARVGRMAWNKGRHLSEEHRLAISRSVMSRAVTEETKHRMRLARRRPGDAIVGGTGGLSKTGTGSYPLMESEGINEYITLRRELRVWSDKFVERNARRPSLADVRRIAPKTIMRKFERYVQMRNRIRGLAADVYGSVNPASVPVAPVGDAASAPRNNNARRIIHVTKHGNRRFVDGDSTAESSGDSYADENDGLIGSQEDMWDMYDRPKWRGGGVDRPESENSLFGAHELVKKKGKLDANDYRMIGKHRLMESIDIHRYVLLRKELERWSAAFKQRFGRTPTLSDAKSRGKSKLYERFCEYLSIRDRMSGLVHEVYGTEIDDTEALKRVNEKGRVILDTLRGAGTADDGSSGSTTSS